MPALTVFNREEWRLVTPPPPRYDLWPQAVRESWRLHGALIACGPGFRGVGWPETPTVRLAALAYALDERRIVTHRSAAWVWGATRRAPEPLELSMRPGVRRPLTIPSNVLMREMRGSDADAVQLGEFSVTTPLRTVIDLLYRVEGFEKRDRIACRLLVQLIENGKDRIETHLREQRRPYRSLARARWHSVYGCPAN